MASEDPSEHVFTKHLEVQGSQGANGSRNFKVVFPSGGLLTNTECAALASDRAVGGNGWTGLFVNQGRAANAATFVGDVKVTQGGM